MAVLADVGEDAVAGLFDALRESERRLPAELAHDAEDLTRRGFGVQHLEHILERERLEVEAVRRVVVGRDRLRVAVDHDRLVARVRQCERRVHAGVVELDALTDAVGARSDDHDLLAVGRRDLGLEVVARVVVGRQRRELPGAGVDRLVDRADREGVTDAANLDLGNAPQLPELSVREAMVLREQDRFRIQLRRVADEVGDLVDEDDLVEEPRVDARRLEHLGDADACPQRLLDDDDPTIRRRLRHLDELVLRPRFVAPVEARPALLERTQRLLQGCRVVAADRHRLADRLHGGCQRGVGRGELLEVEARDLHDDVVERRLEARGRDLGDVVRDLIQPVSESELRGDLRDRKTCRLRRQRRRARDTRVHLDDDDAAIRGIDGELDVAATGVDADRANDVDADVAHLLVLAVGQGECRGDSDRVARVHPDRVDVLDRADHDRVVGGVTHELELVFLPPEDRLLEQHLGRRRVTEAGAGDTTQVALVIGET